MTASWPGVRDELDKEEALLNGRPRKSDLPETPAVDDVTGLCRWLTVVWALNDQHPVTAAGRLGLSGVDGHMVVKRADAPEIRFQPITRLNYPSRLTETLNAYRLQSDGITPAFTKDHCRAIEHVVRMLAGLSEQLSAEQEAAGIVGTFLMSAIAVEGLTTYGNSAQRYDAAFALRRDTDERTGRSTGPPRYLVDADTGELVIGVSDLQDAARRHIGSTLPRGWLEAEMDTLSWQRIQLQGYALPGRSGRAGPHARIHAYRGVWATSDEGSVTT